MTPNQAAEDMRERAAHVAEDNGKAYEIAGLIRALKAGYDLPPDVPPDLGATGEFPLGKLHPDDQGELKTAIRFNKENGMVEVYFGKPVAWVALPPQSAVELAMVLFDKASKSTKR